MLPILGPDPGYLRSAQRILYSAFQIPDTPFAALSRFWDDKSVKKLSRFRDDRAVKKLSGSRDTRKKVEIHLRSENTSLQSFNPRDLQERTESAQTAGSAGENRICAIRVICGSIVRLLVADQHVDS